MSYTGCRAAPRATDHNLKDLARPDIDSHRCSISEGNRFLCAGLECEPYRWRSVQGASNTRHVEQRHAVYGVPLIGTAGTVADLEITCGASSRDDQRRGG